MFMNKINVKITKQVHSFQGYASFYNPFNPELQLKDIILQPESTIINKILHL